MSYVEEKILTKDETVILNVRKSAFSLFWAWVWGILGCWLLLVPVIIAVKKTVLFYNSEYVLTNKEVIEKYGVLNIHVDQMQYQKIENVTVNCTFWGRLFNYGNVCIQGTNHNNINFIGVKNAYDVRKQIADIINID